MIKKIMAFWSFWILNVHAIQEKSFVVVIPSYNNAQWYEKNLDSVCSQDYTNFRIIYIDDCSSDNTADLVSQYIEKHSLKNKITFIQNTNRKYKMANLYSAIHACDDTEIIIELDGDDWLIDRNVLKKINIFYQDQNIWLTYGNYQEFPSGAIGGYVQEIPKSIIENNSFRSYQWVTGHLRSYYAWLFKKIHPDDISYKNEFVSVVADVAIMLPMLEMAGERFKYNSEVLYMYNTATPLNDFKVVAIKNIFEVEAYIRNRPKYSRLNKSALDF